MKKASAPLLRSASSPTGKPIVPQRGFVADLWVLFKNSWFTFDRRTLGLSRIALGFYLLMDLFRRTAAWEEMFSDKGVLPTYMILSRPQANSFSFMHSFTTAPELWAIWAVIAIVYSCLLVGYRTKIMQVASLFIVTSLNGRVLLIENGGYVVQSLLLLWTCFMPLGDRFSVDAMRESLRAKRERTAADLNDRTDLIAPRRLEPFVSIVGPVLCLQLAAVYYFNVIHKFGPDWHPPRLTSVHYVVYVDRMITPIIGHVRDHVHPQIYRFMTGSVMAAEFGVPFCVLAPQLVIFGFDVRLWLRRVGLALINFLHIGFGSTFVLGPFAWGLCVFSTLLFSYEDWDVSIRTMRRTHRARTVVFNADSGAALLFCRIAARCDRFGLLTFREANTDEERTARILVLKGDTARVGASGIADVVAAFPLGPVFAWLLRVPPFGWLCDALLAFGKGRASRLFGLRTLVPEGKPRAPARRYPALVGKTVSELVCFICALAALNQAVVELWCTGSRWRKGIDWLNARYHWELKPQNEYLMTITHKMRFLQGWFMFSPNPVKDDGIVVADAITVDGRHVDPFWGKEPNFDLINAKSFGYNQIWSDYFNRIQTGGNRAYRDPMADYLRRLPERTGNPNDALVSGEVYWVHDFNPRFGHKTSYGQTRTLLCTFQAEGPCRDAQKGGN